MSTPSSILSAALAETQAKITAAAEKAGRRGDEITLVAVTKTHPAETVREALEAGLAIFGENKVQEARAKIPLCPARARWHLVGHLQSNKVRVALGLFELLHSVDSLALAADIARIGGEMGLHPRILLEVNVSGEGSKFGFQPDLLCAQVEDLLALERLQIEGLMTVAPYTEDPEQARPFFGQMRELRDRLGREFALRLDTLSMGMSGDYAVAIEEGATMVRVGSALFGSRAKVGAGM